MTPKEQLLADMQAARGELDEVVNALEASGKLDADVGGGWRARDVLAHIALWERVSARKINNEPLMDPDDPLAGEPWDLDRFNETMRARWRDRSDTEVLGEYRTAHEALLTAVAGADEDACAPGGAVHATIDEDSAGHYPHHLTALRAAAVGG